MTKRGWLIAALVLLLVVYVAVLLWPEVRNVVRERIAKQVVTAWTTLVQKVIVAEYILRQEKPWTAWLLAMIAQESSGVPDKVNPRDPAYGLMQITPPLLSDFNRIKGKSYTVADMKVPYKNVEVGIWYFDMLFHSFQDYDKAVMAYNAGAGNIEAGRPHLERVKEFLSLIQPQLT